MPLQALVSSMGMIFVTELGDKTMLTTICLSAQYRRPFIVLLATMIALGISSTIGVVIGFILATTLPIDLITYISGGLFIMLGIYTIVSSDSEEIASCDNPTTFFGMISLVLFSELGDKSQIAILALAAYSAYPILVFLGALIGFFIVNTMGALLGNRISHQISMNTIQKATGLVFIIFGAAILLHFF